MQRVSYMNQYQRSRSPFDEAIQFMSIRAIYADRKPVSMIYIINVHPVVISEMEAPVASMMIAYRYSASSLAITCLFY